MKLDSLDHLVLTVKDFERTRSFYVGVLGMEDIWFGEGRRALQFGDQKINLHVAGREFEPKAAQPTPGAADLCFLTSTPIDAVMDKLQRCGVWVEEGSVERTGATGPLLSVYVRDPDGNLIEISNRI